jgi:hypothetical protein
VCNFFRVSFPSDSFNGFFEKLKDDRLESEQKIFYFIFDINLVDEKV